MKESPLIVWFRQDLRIADNPALHAAALTGKPIIPVYIYAADEESDWPLGGASKWWLHHSLISLHEALSQIGLDLLVLQGNSLETLQNLIKDTKATGIYWNHRYEPQALKKDRRIRVELQSQGTLIETFNSSLLFDPVKIRNKQGKPFQVFTYFWNQCLASDQPRFPYPQPQRLQPVKTKTPSLSIDQLKLLPTVPWDKGFYQLWTPGIQGAEKRLKSAINHVIETYQETRDRPDIQGVSYLSPHLHYGELSPHQIWHATRSALDNKGSEFLRQLGWREFAHYLLYHFPFTSDSPLKRQFLTFPWQDNQQLLLAWQQGKTGYPIVDAGMRQLWHTGWMHNRVRMIVGSFLVKDLLIHWLEGAKWFWDTLVDADLANNTLGWQWIAGCGADAAPYFRVFNPVTQGEKFDPNGDYVRQWIPELRHLANKWLHQPWNAPEGELWKSKIQMGVDYPKPIVDHAEARIQALKAYESTKLRNE